jgi:methylmalonyl-CoA epimerase
VDIDRPCEAAGTLAKREGGHDVMICGIDHVVIAVKDIDAGIRTWRDGLGLSLSHRASHPEAGLEIAFFSLADGSFMELVSPTSEATPLFAYLRDNREGVRLLCLQVDDLDESVAELTRNGVALDGVGTPRVFIRPEAASGVAVQLWPKDRPHRWRDGEPGTANTAGE